MCNEGQWPSNTPAQKRDREFLQKGISFIPEAIKEGANLQNTAFIFCFQEEDFTVTSGNHDWEFIFFIENGAIQVKCTRVPTRRWLWNVIKECWNRIVDYGRNFAYQALTGRSYKAENALTVGVRCPDCSELNSSSARFCSGCRSVLNWSQHDLVDTDNKDRRTREYKQLIGFRKDVIVSMSRLWEKEKKIEFPTGLEPMLIIASFTFINRD